MSVEIKYQWHVCYNMAGSHTETYCVWLQ